MCEVRSLLFVPGDSPKKLDKALTTDADALILDLEDSVARDRKEEARRIALAFLRSAHETPKRPILYVRINAFGTGLSEGDLDVVMTAAPDGVMLPKAGGGSDIALLDSRLSVCEALHGMPEGSTRILPIVTETATAIFAAGTYGGSSSRLSGLAWGAEDLAADIGALSPRVGGSWTDPFSLARSLCLFGAAAAQVAAVDTVYTDFRGLDGLRQECEAAVRDGFSAKLAIHPAQVAIINAAFTPSAAAIAHAETVVAAFSDAVGTGVISLDGQMLDQPHLTAAQRLLSRARGARTQSPAEPRPS
jgi:citrate lyase subunit beta/citryl-CoA lyase